MHLTARRDIESQEYGHCGGHHAADSERESYQLLDRELVEFLFKMACHDDIKLQVSDTEAKITPPARTEKDTKNR